MRELRLRVPAAAVEDVLDRLLPLAPAGVREEPSGDHVELRLRGAELPAVADVVRAAGRWRHHLTESAVPDDWRERRVLDYRPDVIGGRLVVRPEWAPRAGHAEIDIVLREGSGAFGAGTHPTTRTCLELLLELPPYGSFADLGCGTGVLAILAAKLGFAPVTAADVDSEAVDAVAAHGEANGVTVHALLSDLAEVDPPPAEAIAANFPSWLHEIVAPKLPGQVEAAIVSGFGPETANRVLRAYASVGLGCRRQLEPHGWVVALLGRD